MRVVARSDRPAVVPANHLSETGEGEPGSGTFGCGCPVWILEVLPIGVAGEPDRLHEGMKIGRRVRARVASVRDFRVFDEHRPETSIYRSESLSCPSLDLRSTMPPRAAFPLLLVLVLLAGGCGVNEAATGSESGEPPKGSPVNGFASHSARILVDESGKDWERHPVQFQDAEDDGGEIDLQRLQVAHSQRYLFLRIEVGTPINLQEDNELTLYLDTDNESSTGKRAVGVGAEVTWSFGGRSGQAVFNGHSQEIGHADIGLTTLPTVQSETFEVALDRSAKLGSSTSLFESDSLRIALSTGEDRLPDEDGGIGYVLSDTNLEATIPTIARPASEAVRILSYNVLRDALFDGARQANFGRILRAVGPDVVGFQEVYEHSASQTGETVEDVYGGAAGWDWTKAGSDLVVGSRYPILETHTIPGYDDYRSAAALLDADEGLGRPLLFIVMHPPCCNYSPEDGEPSSNAQRQLVVDGVAAFIRDVKQGDGPFQVAPNTPIVVAGDMNFVGSAQQRETLRTGEIINIGRFGSGIAPDWDGSPLLDTKPPQTARPLFTTWVDAESSFPPGRLDYAYVTDSVLEVAHEFVLFTPALSDTVHNKYDLRPADTRRASDHLPLVIDVAPK